MNDEEEKEAVMLSILKNYHVIAVVGCSREEGKACKNGRMVARK